MGRMKMGIALVVLAGAGAAPLEAKPAKPPTHPQAEAQTVELARQLIALRTVQGPDNRTGDALKLIKRELLSAGWADGDVEIVPVDDTAYLISTWVGSDPKLKPLVVSGHIDVVEADPKDWERDPFTPVIEDGILYGRGASDMKFDAAQATASLIELRRSGYKPRRTIVLQFSGDEETTMKTSRIIAERLKHAELVLNIDGNSGVLDEASGEPLYWSWQGAEKTYVDFRLEVTNPGGHSSAPRPVNAIAQMSEALARIGAYRFKAEVSPLTKAYFESAAQFESDPALAGAMRAFAANPDDQAALALLRAHSGYVGKVGTTCVPTMVNGGHAQNALPQRVTANVNCRVFPGHSREEIRQELLKVAANEAVTISDATGEDSIESEASPMRADFLAAATKAIRSVYPGIAIFPSQASGASDSMWYRALGVPSYGATPTFAKDSEDFAHGRNERVRLSNVAPGVSYYLSLLRDLSK